MYGTATQVALELALRLIDSSDVERRMSRISLRSLILSSAAEASFHRQRVSRIRHTHMGVRVEIRDGESVEQAYKRFKQLLWRHGPTGAGRKRSKWHKRPHDHYLKLSELARRDELRDAFETYAGECARRRLVCVIRRRTKKRKKRFGDAPVVCKSPVSPAAPVVDVGPSAEPDPA